MARHRRTDPGKPGLTDTDSEDDARIDEEIDEEIDESFPASDPPGHNGSRPGKPRGNGRIRPTPDES